MDDSRTDPMRRPAAFAAGDVRAAGIRGLDSTGVLQTVMERRRQADRAEADLLALAVHLVDLHPVGDDVLEATWAASNHAVLADGEFALPAPEPLGGVGTPAVADFAVAELGAAMGVGYQSALTFVSEAVELCFRLPRLWDLVQSGRLQAWRARQVAAATPQLSRAAVEFVDRHAAVIGVRNRVPDPARLRDLVHEALLQFDPDTAAAREESALNQRDVRFTHPASTGCSKMIADLDTLDAFDLDATITDLAATMGRLGDDSDLGVRRSHALGMLGHPQRVLDLFGDPRPAPTSGDVAGESDVASPDADPGVARQAAAPGVAHPSAGWSRTSSTLFVHLTLTELARLADVVGDPGRRTARVRCWWSGWVRSPGNWCGTGSCAATG